MAGPGRSIVLIDPGETSAPKISEAVKKLVFRAVDTKEGGNFDFFMNVMLKEVVTRFSAYAEFIDKVARAFDVDPNLIYAVIYYESEGKTETNKFTDKYGNQVTTDMQNIRIGRVTSTTTMELYDQYFSKVNNLDQSLAAKMKNTLWENDPEKYMDITLKKTQAGFDQESSIIYCALLISILTSGATRDDGKKQDGYGLAGIAGYNAGMSGMKVINKNGKFVNGKSDYTDYVRAVLGYYAMFTKIRFHDLAYYRATKGDPISGTTISEIDAFKKRYMEDNLIIKCLPEGCLPVGHPNYHDWEKPAKKIGALENENFFKYDKA